MLSVLDYEGLGAESQDILGGFVGIFGAGEEFGFGVVDEQDIQTFKDLEKVVAVVVDPVIHSVAAGEFGVGHGVVDALLEDGIDVGEEEEL